MPGGKAREIWRSVVDGTFELEGKTGTELGHRVKTQVWFLEDLLVASFAAEANTVHRTKALIKRNQTAVLKVRIYRGGHSLLIDGDEQTKLGTGAIHFIDHDRPMRQVSSDHEQLTISVPHHLIGYVPGVHPACFSIGMETARGRMIHAALSALFEDIGSLPPSEAPALSAAVVALLRGSLSGGLDSQIDEDVRRTRIIAFKQYIDQNLADPQLGVEALLRDFGASRATIYRDFAEVGGLQHYILERRLQRAYRFLAEEAPVRGNVQDVALRCGFSSLGHFSRRFRASFGMTPSDVVGQWSRGIDQALAGGLTGSSFAAEGATTIAALQWAYKRFK